jgi:hypothetical protein
VCLAQRVIEDACVASDGLGVGGWGGGVTHVEVFNERVFARCLKVTQRAHDARHVCRQFDAAHDEKSMLIGRVATTPVAWVSGVAVDSGRKKGVGFLRVLCGYRHFGRTGETACVFGLAHGPCRGLPGNTKVKNEPGSSFLHLDRRRFPQATLATKLRVGRSAMGWHKRIERGSERG